MKIDVSMRWSDRAPARQLKADFEVIFSNPAKIPPLAGLGRGRMWVTLGTGRLPRCQDYIVSRHPSVVPQVRRTALQGCVTWVVTQATPLRADRIAAAPQDGYEASQQRR
jgi:hypothetical protein